MASRHRVIRCGLTRAMELRSGIAPGLVGKCGVTGTFARMVTQDVFDVLMRWCDPTYAMRLVRAPNLFMSV